MDVWIRYGFSLVNFHSRRIYIKKTGSTGNQIFIDLGFGLGCCICTKHELDTDGNEFIGVGIQPDIVAEEDIDTFLNNGDSVIEKALDLLRNK